MRSKLRATLMQTLPPEAASAAPPGMPRAVAPWRCRRRSPGPRGSPLRQNPRQLDGDGGRFWGSLGKPWETPCVFPKDGEKHGQKCQTRFFP
ncbi:unnamed protein product [Cladocopium goreaui]|uniref:Uncharacterized protein n=1 Tax=Cladocopium goreaui TaxID=2562237 RepID=A0A9P1GBK3_9DINO|nr:unnamed protein product [Cladocopium goreaui]